MITFLYSSLVASTDSNYVLVWAVATSSLVAKIAYLVYGRVSFSPDSTRLAIAYDAIVAVFDLTPIL